MDPIWSVWHQHQPQDHVPGRRTGDTLCHHGRTGQSPHPCTYSHSLGTTLGLPFPQPSLQRLQKSCSLTWFVHTCTRSGPNQHAGLLQLCGLCSSLRLPSPGGFSCHQAPIGVWVSIPHLLVACSGSGNQLCLHGTDSALHRSYPSSSPMSFLLPVVTVGFSLYSLQLGFFCSFLLQIHPCPPQAEVLHTLQLFDSAPASSSQRCPMPWALSENPLWGLQHPARSRGGLLPSLSQNAGVQGPRTAGWQAAWRGTVCARVSLCDGAGAAPESASRAFSVIYEVSSGSIAPLPGRRLEMG